MLNLSKILILNEDKGSKIVNDLDEVICPCYDLTLKNIIDAIEENDITSLEQLEDITGAGTICGACLYELEDIVEKYKKK